MKINNEQLIINNLGRGREVLDAQLSKQRSDSTLNTKLLNDNVRQRVI